MSKTKVTFIIFTVIFFMFFIYQYKDTSPETTPHFHAGQVVRSKNGGPRILIFTEGIWTRSTGVPTYRYSGEYFDNIGEMHNCIEFEYEIEEDK